MTEVDAIVRQLGGMAQKQQLARRGVRGFQLTAAVRSGVVIRVRNGWYSTMDEQDPRLRAVRVGGRLTGISALQSMGAWVLNDHPLHVSLHDNAARMRTQGNRFERLNVNSMRDVALHWDETSVRGFGTSTIVGVREAFIRAALDEKFETVVALFDWGLHTGVLDVLECESIVARLPLDRRGISACLDDRCDSLPESLARTRLRLSGHQVRSQVSLGDFRRIDLVVDGVVGLEVDGAEYHRDRFEPDRDKDIEITLDHLHAIRVSARAVFHGWSRIADDISTAIADRGLELQNSGDSIRAAFRSPGMTGWRRPGDPQSPEF